MRKRVSMFPAFVEPTHESHATLQTVDHTVERFSLRDVGFATKDILGFQSPATGAHALETQAPIDYSVAFRQTDATPLTRSDIVVDTVPSHSARHGARF